MTLSAEEAKFLNNAGFTDMQAGKNNLNGIQVDSYDQLVDTFDAGTFEKK